LTDFWPISLVNNVYEILSTVLANRLRQVIVTIIFDTQSTFVKGSQILDGILIANELVDDATNTKKELLLLKVDFKKCTIRWIGVI